MKEKMKKDQIYVSVDSINYWWGIYGISYKVGWEDITIYNKDIHGLIKAARVCICTKAYLQGGLEDLEQDPDEKEFVSAVNQFLNDEEVVYRYSYDNPEDEEFYEVPFKAERNEKGVKPCYIEIWHPSDLIDEAVIKECVTLFCSKFLNLTVWEVKFKDVVSIEEAIKDFIEHCKIFNKDSKIIFSDELVKQLELEWNKPREKVLEVLNRSTKYDE